MRKKLGLGILFLFIIISASVVEGLARVEKYPVIVIFKDRPQKNLIKKYGGRIKYTYSIIPGIACWLPEKAIEALEKNKNVESIEKDIKVSIPGKGKGHGPKKPKPTPTPTPEPTPTPTPEPTPTPTPEPTPTPTPEPTPTPTPEPTPTPTPGTEVLPWGVDRVDAELAWSTDTGKNVQVAILDTGIDGDHADLDENILAGINFVWSWLPWIWDPGAWDDDHGHGTWCAGVVGAVDNDLGVVGVAPSVDLVAVKVLDASGSGYISDIIAGIEWCTENGIEVISMSFGGPSYSPALHQACDEAYMSGVVLVAAAGNSGDGDPYTDDVEYPAKHSSVIAVSALDGSDAVPGWCSSGNEVEFSAPGVDIHSTWMGNKYETHSGTSGACPHVSGTIALFIKQDITSPPFSNYYLDNGNGRWDPNEVVAWLDYTSDDLGAPGRDTLYGFGIVDAEEAATGQETNE